MAGEVHVAIPRRPIRVGAFYLMVVLNWLLAFFILLMPSSKYEWMLDEYGKDTVLPEDHSNLGFFVASLGLICIVVAIAIAAFGWWALPKPGAQKTRIVLALAPALVAAAKLLLLR